MPTILATSQINATDEITIELVSPLETSQRRRHQMARRPDDRVQPGQVPGNRGRRDPAPGYGDDRTGRDEGGLSTTTEPPAETSAGGSVLEEV